MLRCHFIIVLEYEGRHLYKIRPAKCFISETVASQEYVDEGRKKGNVVIGIAN